MPANEQPGGAYPARSATKIAGRGSLPGWEVGADAGYGKVARRGRREVGNAALSDYESSCGRMKRHERSRENVGSPSREPSITTTRPTPQEMWEKLWTLPLNPYEEDYKIEDDHKPITAHDRTTVAEFTTND